MEQIYSFVSEKFNTIICHTIGIVVMAHLYLFHKSYPRLLNFWVYCVKM